MSPSGCLTSRLHQCSAAGICSILVAMKKRFVMRDAVSKLMLHAWTVNGPSGRQRRSSSSRKKQPLKLTRVSTLPLMMIHKDNVTWRRGCCGGCSEGGGCQVGAAATSCFLQNASARLGAKQFSIMLSKCGAFLVMLACPSVEQFRSRCLAAVTDGSFRDTRVPAVWHHRC